MMRRVRHTPQDRLRLMEPVLAAQAALYAGERLIFVLSSGRCTGHLDEFVRDYGERAGISASSLWRWCARFRDHGIEGLTDNARSDKGTSVRLRDTALILVFARWAAGRRARAIHGELVQLWSRLQRDGSRPPSLATVRRTIRGFAAAAPRPQEQPEKAQP